MSLSYYFRIGSNTSTQAGQWGQLPLSLQCHTVGYNPASVHHYNHLQLPIRWHVPDNINSPEVQNLWYIACCRHLVVGAAVSNKPSPSSELLPPKCRSMFHISSSYSVSQSSTLLPILHVTHLSLHHLKDRPLPIPFSLFARPKPLPSSSSFQTPPRWSVEYPQSRHFVVSFSRRTQL
jgi:hypothetical protein